MSTSNPAWLDSDIGSLYPFVTNADYLELCWIKMLVRDKSEFKTSTIGTGVIRLAGACGDNPVPFSTPIVDKGRLHGKIEGDVHILYHTTSGSGLAK